MNGRLARLHRRMVAAIEASKAAEETAAELRGRVLEADNEVSRLRDELAEVLGRLGRIEAATAPKGYTSRGRA